MFLVIVVRSAWVCDDAYITLRTVDNLYHGYGLTWNVGERVQTYTHPLWFLVLASTYFLSGNPYYLLLGLSILISGVVVILLCYQLALSTVHAILGILMLLASKAFIDYSTSGLENPLSHLLIILFIIIFLNQPPGKFWVLALTLTTSLGMMNRMDLALFFLPAIVYTIWERHTKQDRYSLRGFRICTIYSLGAVLTVLLWISISKYCVCETEHRHSQLPTYKTRYFLFIKFDFQRPGHLKHYFCWRFDSDPRAESSSFVPCSRDCPVFTLCCPYRRRLYGRALFVGKRCRRCCLVGKLEVTLPKTKSPPSGYGGGVAWAGYSQSPAAL